MKHTRWLFGSVVVFAGLVAGCRDQREPDPGAAAGRAADDRRVLHERQIDGGTGASLVAEVWVDNWFRLSVNGEPLVEDSVPYPTERSFNAERVAFNAEFPMTLAFELRDFKENDTGLEYIGSDRQQVGDGGAIAQFTDKETGATVAVTDASWKCLVIHHAPVDAACAREQAPKEGQGPCRSTSLEAPAGWDKPGFDDAQWHAATEHSVSAVRPKDGYDEIEWKPGAKLIWSDDLRLDNTVLCRAVIDASP